LIQTFQEVEGTESRLASCASTQLTVNAQFLLNKDHRPVGANLAATAFRAACGKVLRMLLLLQFEFFGRGEAS
jgi:hypothetical protein